jgi:zinc-binding alcohol dehydrogenase/oxidoreductase
MQALVLLENDAPLYHGEWEDPQPGEGETVVYLRAAALNHRDVFITQGLYPGIHYPVILGSDGAGTLDDGREVLINPAMGWGDDPHAQSPNFNILGLPRDGTFAERVVAPKEKIYDKPAHLSWEAAAALPLTGVTAYRALFNRGQLRQNDRVLISGIGGGVALFLFQFATAAGAEVWVTSGSEKKIERAVGMGAKGGANYKAEDWPEQLKKQAGGFDLIIDGAGGPGFGHFLKLCRPAARIVIYGGTLGKLPALRPQIIFWKQLSILGSTMGTDAEFAAMLEFVTKHRIEPVIDKVFPLSEGQRAFERMEKGLQFGKIVLKM